MTGEELYYEISEENDAYSIFSEFLKNPKGKIFWKKIPTNEYIKALNEFVRFGRFMHFNGDVVYTWMSKILYDIIKLKNCTDLYGHSRYFEADFLNDYRWVIDDNIDGVDNFLSHIGEHSSTYNKDDLNNTNNINYSIGSDILERIGFYNWAELPDGSPAMSDFGLDPMFDILTEYNTNFPPEKVLVIINRILDVYHQRGDLTSIFIDGGSKTLSRISQTENKTKKLVINENILKIFLTEMTKKEINAACKQIEKNPSEEQIKAGNYKKAHINVNGFKITIENAKGSVRRGVDSNGNKWEIKMNNHYGYFNTTEGKDGDHIDVFIGENLDSDKIFVVDQLNEKGDFDEHKVMLGFDNERDAKKGYLANYSKGWTGFGCITEVSVDDFKDWLYSNTKRIKEFSKYKKLNEDYNVLKPNGIYLGKRGGTLQFIRSDSVTAKNYDTLVGTINRINRKTNEKVPKNALSSLVASDSLQRGIKVLPNGVEVGLYNVNEIAYEILAKDSNGKLIKNASGNYVLSEEFKNLIKYYNK